MGSDAASLCQFREAVLMATDQRDGAAGMLVYRPHWNGVVSRGESTGLLECLRRFVT
jgi:tagatose-1,6-bisphosphate aldolase